MENNGVVPKNQIMPASEIDNQKKGLLEVPGEGEFQKELDLSGQDPEQSKLQKKHELLQQVMVSDYASRQVFLIENKL